MKTTKNIYLPIELLRRKTTVEVLSWCLGNFPKGGYYNDIVGKMAQNKEPLRYAKVIRDLAREIGGTHEPTIKS